jgi:WD40 repeat protein
MQTDEKTARKQIIHAPSQSIAVRSAALVARGLRDLTRNSNWLVKKAFFEHVPHLSISPTGKVCALLPTAGPDAQQIGVYDLDKSDGSRLTLLPKRNPDAGSFDARAAFAWSPTSQYLVAAGGAWQPVLHLFDLQRNSAPDGLGKLSICPSFLSWSGAGSFFAAASAGGNNASLGIWNVSRDITLLLGPPDNSLGTLDGQELQPLESQFDDDGAFSGYGRMAFSPDEKSLAVVLEYKGDWADDSILVTDAPSMRGRDVFQAHGHITDLSWTPDNRQAIYCTGGQAYRLTASSMVSEELSFAAELCACHPFVPICVCYSSWLKNSAEGRLCVFDLNRLEILDECAAEGIVALRWSQDGSKAYALTQDGLAYIYESPIF